jgi:23S rRNA (adenine2503-C2)-methyltransferase
MKNKFEILRYLSKDGNIRKFVFISKDQKISFETSSFFTSARKDQGGTLKTPSFLTPNHDIHDICISTMAGCPMGCRICSTTYSSIPFERVLSAEEMCVQVKLAIQERNKVASDTLLRIGFMGNGEPFGNFDNMVTAIQKMVFEDKIPIETIAISTIGVNIYQVQELEKIMKKVGIDIKLQLSLYSIDHKIRQDLLPLAPELDSIFPQLDWYASVSGIPVRYNVPLISGVNNTAQQLAILKDFLLEKPEFRRLKLSAYNAFPGGSFHACSDDELFRTFEWFESYGVKVDLFLGDRDPVVLASCGQMRSFVLKS